MDYTLAGTVILSGMGIVFLVLILLTFIVMLFGKIMEKTTADKGSKPTAEIKKAAPAPAPAPKAAPLRVVEEGISEEVVAVISASIAAMLGGSAGFTIKSVKRARDARSVWSMAGLAQNTNPF